jgi:hypothetical protein
VYTFDKDHFAAPDFVSFHQYKIGGGGGDGTKSLGDLTAEFHHTAIDIFKVYLCLGGACIAVACGVMWCAHTRDASVVGTHMTLAHVRVRVCVCLCVCVCVFVYWVG